MKEKLVDGWPDGQTNKLVGGQMSGWMAGQINCYSGGRMEG